MFTLFNRILIGAIQILCNWLTKFSPFAILTLCTFLLLVQATYAYVGPVTVNLQTDGYGYETSWDIRNSNNIVIARGGHNEYEGNASITEVVYLIGSGFTFTIYDSDNNGICCDVDSGNGSYSLEDSVGAVIASGGEFGSSESTTFDIASEATPPSKLGPVTLEVFTEANAPNEPEQPAWDAEQWEWDDYSFSYDIWQSEYNEWKNNSYIYANWYLDNSHESFYSFEEIWEDEYRKIILPAGKAVGIDYEFNIEWDSHGYDVSYSLKYADDTVIPSEDNTPDWGGGPEYAPT